MAKSEKFFPQVIFIKRDRKLRGKVNCKMTKFRINQAKQPKLSVEYKIQNLCWNQSNLVKKGKKTFHTEPLITSLHNNIDSLFNLS